MTKWKMDLGATGMFKDGISAASVIIFTDPACGDSGD